MFPCKVRCGKVTSQSTKCLTDQTLTTRYYFHMVETLITFLHEQLRLTLTILPRSKHEKWERLFILEKLELKRKTQKQIGIII